MLGVFFVSSKISFFSFLHSYYTPNRGIKSTLNAKNFYTIALPNYSRSSRCQIQTLNARPKFAGQMELQKLRIPGKWSCESWIWALYGAENYFPGNKIGATNPTELYSGSSKLSIFSFLDLRETGKLCYNYYRKEKEKKTFREFAQWFSSNR